MRHTNSVLLVLVATAGLAILTVPDLALARAGKLDRPSISIPTVGEGEASTPDRICSAIQETLNQHSKQFVSGRFVNAHSTMEFGGTAAELNALLKDLAVIEGAKIQIRFSEGSDDLLKPYVKAEGDKLPYQWKIEHNAWGDAQYLSITIFVGDGGIKVEDVQIPMIVGHPSARTSDGGIGAKASAER